jgi:hypothetical protein
MLKLLTDAYEILNELQWSRLDKDSGIRKCQYCGSADYEPHVQGCKIGKLISQLEEIQTSNIHRYSWSAEGFLSGDGESFCLAATKEECLRSLRETRPQTSDSCFLGEDSYYKGFFHLYPKGIPYEDEQQFSHKKIRYTIHTEIKILPEDP